MTYNDWVPDPDIANVGYHIFVLALFILIVFADVATSDANVIANSVPSPFVNVIVDTAAEADIIPRKGNDDVVENDELVAVDADIAYEAETAADELIEYDEVILFDELIE